MGDGYPSDWNQRRRRVYQRDNYQCQKCGRRGGPHGNAELHAHHITPKSKGGSHDYSNLQTLCQTCHSQAHGRSIGGSTESTTTSSPSKKTASGPGHTALLTWTLIYLLGGIFLTFTIPSLQLMNGWIAVCIILGFTHYTHLAKKKPSTESNPRTIIATIVGLAILSGFLKLSQHLSPVGIITTLLYIAISIVLLLESSETSTSEPPLRQTIPLFTLLTALAFFGASFLVSSIIAATNPSPHFYYWGNNITTNTIAITPAQTPYPPWKQLTHITATTFLAFTLNRLYTFRSTNTEPNTREHKTTILLQSTATLYATWLFTHPIPTNNPIQLTITLTALLLTTTITLLTATRTPPSTIWQTTPSRT